MQDLQEFRQLVAAHPLEAAPLGLEVDLDEDAEEIETGRNGGGLGDLDVGGVGEFGHQEGRGAHDGGMIWPPVEAAASTAPANSGR